MYYIYISLWSNVMSLFSLVAYVYSMKKYTKLNVILNVNRTCLRSFWFTRSLCTRAISAFRLLAVRSESAAASHWDS